MDFHEIRRMVWVGQKEQWNILGMLCSSLRINIFFFHFLEPCCQQNYGKRAKNFQYMSGIRRQTIGLTISWLAGRFHAPQTKPGRSLLLLRIPEYFCRILTLPCARREITTIYNGGTTWDFCSWQNLIGIYLSNYNFNILYWIVLLHKQWMI